MLVVALSAAPAVAQEVRFAYDFKPGASERHRVKLNQEMDMGGMAIGYLADMSVSLKCVSGADGKYSMEMKFDKVDVSTSMMGNVSANPIGEQLVGQAITFDVDASGDVNNIKPVGAFDAWDTAKQLVEPVIDRWYIHLPNQAVAVGGSWKKEGEKELQSSGTQTVTNTTYTYKAMKKEKGRDVAVIDQAQDSKISGVATTPMGIFNVDGSGQGKFEILFDPAQSRVVKFKGKIDVSMDMTPQAGGDLVQMIVANHFERELLE
jgi:hypothetical protein